MIHWMIWVLASLAAVSGLVVLLVYIITSLKQPKLEFNPDVTNFIPQFTDGHRVGVETDCRQISKDRLLVSFVPRLSKKEIEKEKDLMEYDIVIPTSSRILIDKGLTGGRELIWYLPSTKKEIPDVMMENIIGKFLSKKINYDDIVKWVNEYQEGFKQVGMKLMSKFPKEPIDKMVDRFEEMAEALRDIIGGKEKKEKPYGGTSAGRFIQ